MRHTAVAILVAIVLAASGARSSADPVPNPPCADWVLHMGPTTVNALAPDGQANYWFHHYSTLPGSRLRIEGQYPKARFFSFAVQDETLMTLGSLRDDRIAPDKSNPSSYTAYVDFGATPANPARN